MLTALAATVPPRIAHALIHAYHQGRHDAHQQQDHPR